MTASEDLRHNFGFLLLRKARETTSKLHAGTVIISSDSERIKKLLQLSQ